MAKRFNLSVGCGAQLTAAGTGRPISSDEPTECNSVAIEMLTQLRTIKGAALFATMIRRYWPPMRPLCVCLACVCDSRSRGARECCKISNEKLGPRRNPDCSPCRSTTGQQKRYKYIPPYGSPRVNLPIGEGRRRRCEDADP